MIVNGPNSHDLSTGDPSSHCSVLWVGGGTPDKRSIFADGYEDSKWAEKYTPLSMCADVYENSKWAEKR